MKLPLPRFSIRTLLIAMLCMGGILGIVGREVARIRSDALIEDETIRHLLDRGAEIEFHSGQQTTWLASLIEKIDGREQAQVRAVTLVGSKLNRSDIDRIARLPKLHGLYCTCENAEDAWCGELAKCQSLRYLVMSGGKCTPKGARQLITEPSQLAILVLDTPVDDAFLQQAAKSTTLRTLNIQGNSITAEGIAVLRNSRSLESLSITGGAGLGNGFAALGENSRLQQLAWSQETIRSDELQSVAQLDSLTSLTLTTFTFPRDLLPILAKLPNLKSLQLHGQFAPGNDVGVFVFPKLQNFSASASNFQPSLLHQFAASKSLLSISAPQHKITEAELAALAKLPQLNMLKVADSPAKEAIEAFQKSQPYCVYLDAKWGFFQPKIGINPTTLGGGMNKDSIVAPPNLR